MWGEKVSLDKVNFEWPTVDVLQELDKEPKELQLTEINFGRRYVSKFGVNLLSSIQVVLNQDIRSPSIKAGENYAPDTSLIKLDNKPQQKVCSVVGYSLPNTAA